MKDKSSVQTPTSRSRSEPAPESPRPRASTRYRSSSPFDPSESEDSSEDLITMVDQERPLGSRSSSRIEKRKEHAISKSAPQYQQSQAQAATSTSYRHSHEIGHPSPSHVEARNEACRSPHNLQDKDANGRSGPGLLAKVAGFGFWSSTPKSSPLPKNDFTPPNYQTEYESKNLRREDGGRLSIGEQTSSHQFDRAKVQQKFQDVLEKEKSKWEKKTRKDQSDNERTIRGLTKLARESEDHIRHLESGLQQIKSEKRQTDEDHDALILEYQHLKSRLRQSEAEKHQIQEEHTTFIRKQQEASFSQMESARWLPKEESKVMEDLDRLKTSMRNWARSTSIKDISLLRSLGQENFGALMQVLAKVAVLENDQIPEALFIANKTPMLLLNAVLAQCVYTTFFKNPFFWLSKNDDHILEIIYDLAKRGNQEDAHLWRSQTLRLLMPPLLSKTTAGEKSMRNQTELAISNSAAVEAAKFLTGPARHLINMDAKPDVVAKVNKIFNDAATMAYMLWTRRTKMNCVSFDTMTNVPTFDAGSPFFDPDSLVRFEDHADELKGRPITLIVHPLLQAFGTDEAKDYDKGRVWAKGVVWLDSREEEES